MQRANIAGLVLVIVYSHWPYMVLWQRMGTFILCRFMLGVSFPEGEL